MKVVVDNHTLFVGWQYDNKQNPTVTSCIIKNENKEVVTEITIRKHVNDKQLGREGARRLSLQKLLSVSFPGKDSKDTRELFWNAYLTRNDASKRPTLTVVHVNGENNGK